MTVDDLLKVLNNPDMIRIINDGSDVYVGNPIHKFAGKL